MKHIMPVALLLIVAAGLQSCSRHPFGAPPAEREVQFKSAGVTLSGTLVVPQKMLAAVVIVHGSGQQLRKMPFAQSLARAGVAALTYDKRGVGESGGAYMGPEVGRNNVDAANLELLADDAAAAVQEIVRQIGSPQTPVGLIGFSQAGWIIPLTAVRAPNVKFMILWSGPLVSTHEQLRFQFLTNTKADFWDHHSEAEARQHIRSDVDRFQFVDTDPVDSLRKLSVPGLWLYGGRDVNVPSGLSIERLQALAASGKPFGHVVFPNAGHELPRDQAFNASMDWLKRTIVPSEPP